VSWRVRKKVYGRTFLSHQGRIAAISLKILLVRGLEIGQKRQRYRRGVSGGEGEEKLKPGISGRAHERGVWKRKVSTWRRCPNMKKQKRGVLMAFAWKRSSVLIEFTSNFKCITKTRGSRVFSSFVEGDCHKNKLS